MWDSVNITSFAVIIYLGRIILISVASIADSRPFLRRMYFSIMLSSLKTRLYIPAMALQTPAITISNQLSKSLTHYVYRIQSPFPIMPLNPLHDSVIPLLDPLFVEYYNKNIADQVSTHQVPLAEIRGNPQCWARPTAVDASNNPRVKDWTVSVAEGEDIQARAYSPDESVWGAGPYAVHINFHGASSLEHGAAVGFDS